MIGVTVHLKDGDELSYSAVAPPWEWRQFLVINQGTERLTYVPMHNVSTFTMAVPVLTHSW